MTDNVYLLRVSYEIRNPPRCELLLATAEDAVKVAREYMRQNAGDWHPVNGTEPDLDSDSIYGFWQDHDSTRHYVEVQAVAIHRLPNRPILGFDPAANLARMLKGL